VRWAQKARCARFEFYALRQTEWVLKNALRGIDRPWGTRWVGKLEFRGSAGPKSERQLLNASLRDAFFSLLFSSGLSPGSRVAVQRVPPGLLSCRPSGALFAGAARPHLRLVVDGAEEPNSGFPLTERKARAKARATATVRANAGPSASLGMTAELGGGEMRVPRLRSG